MDSHTHNKYIEMEEILNLCGRKWLKSWIASVFQFDFLYSFYGGVCGAPHSKSSGGEESHMLTISTFLPLVKDLLSPVITWFLP